MLKRPIDALVYLIQGTHLALGISLAAAHCQSCPRHKRTLILIGPKGREEGEGEFQDYIINAPCGVVLQFSSLIVFKCHYWGFNNNQDDLGRRRKVGKKKGKKERNCFSTCPITVPRKVSHQSTAEIVWQAMWLTFNTLRYAHTPNKDPMLHDRTE